MKRGQFLLTTAALIPLVALAKFAEAIGSASKKAEGAAPDDPGPAGRNKVKRISSKGSDLKISSDETGGNVAVFVQDGSLPERSQPLHLHLYQDEWIYIIEGEYIIQLNSEKLQMRAGDTIFLPRNIQHAFVRITDNARILVSYAPAGKIEDFFKVAESWSSLTSDEEIAQAFEDHGMKITGPAINA